jgi:hypothetical protein
MANARVGNVLVCDTSGAIAGNQRICGIRWLPAGTTPSVSIKKGSSSGTVMYENANESAEFNEVELRANDGIYVTLAGTGAKVYIYLE